MLLDNMRGFNEHSIRGPSGAWWPTSGNQHLSVRYASSSIFIGCQLDTVPLKCIILICEICAMSAPSRPWESTRVKFRGLKHDHCVKHRWMLLLQAPEPAGTCCSSDAPGAGTDRARTKTHLLRNRSGATSSWWKQWQRQAEGGRENGSFVCASAWGGDCCTCTVCTSNQEGRAVRRERSRVLSYPREKPRRRRFWSHSQQPVPVAPGAVTAWVLCAVPKGSLLPCYYREQVLFFSILENALIEQCYYRTYGLLGLSKPLLGLR